MWQFIDHIEQGGEIDEWVKIYFDEKAIDGNL